MRTRRRRRHLPRRAHVRSTVAMTRKELTESISLGIEQAEARRQAAEKAREDQVNEQWCAQFNCPENFDSLTGWKRVHAEWHIFWAIVWRSFRRRRAEEGSLVLRNFIAHLLSGTFGFFSWALLLMGAWVGVCQPIVYIAGQGSSIELYSIITMFVVGFIFFCISRIFKFISDEIFVEKDTSFLIAIMSMLLALASLIVSIVK